MASLRHAGCRAGILQGSFRTRANPCTAVYSCARKGCTFWCMLLCDTGFLLAASASPVDITVHRQASPAGILAGSI